MSDRKGGSRRVKKGRETACYSWVGRAPAVRDRSGWRDVKGGRGKERL